MRVHPRTRMAMESSDTNTTPMVMMWTDCTAGTIHLTDLIVTLTGVISSHCANSKINRWPLLSLVAGGLQGLRSQFPVPVAVPGRGYEVGVGSGPVPNV